MRKEFHLLEVGDVIWANPSDIGSHIFIICDINEEDNYECYQSVNLSSDCSYCDTCCIKIEDEDIPKDWFGITNDISYLRIDNPKCLEPKDYENDFKSYKGNLKSDYLSLWNKICERKENITNQVCECEYC